MNLRTILWGAFILAAAAIAWLFLRGQPVEVDAGTVRRGNIRSTVEEEGKSKVVQRYTVSTPVAGRLLRVSLDAGDPVQKGQVLAEIDPLDAESRIEEAAARIAALKARMETVQTKAPKKEEIEEAELREKSAVRNEGFAAAEVEAAKATLAQAQLDAKRAEALARTGSGGVEAAEQAATAAKTAAAVLHAKEALAAVRGIERKTAALDTVLLHRRLEDLKPEVADLKAQMEGVEAELKPLRDNLKRTRIQSPVTGVVLKRYLQSEQVLTAGQPVLMVGSLDGLEVEADFLSEDAAKMRAGMPAELFAGALGDRTVAAKVSLVHPQAFTKISSLGVEQQRVTVECKPEAPLRGVGDAYRIDIRVILQEKDGVVLVPEGALFRYGSAWSVFRIEGGKARRTEVETGLSDGRNREVLKGLKEGEKVILHPSDRIEEGTRVVN